MRCCNALQRWQRAVGYKYHSIIHMEDEKALLLSTLHISKYLFSAVNFVFLASCCQCA